MKELNTRPRECVQMHTCIPADLRDPGIQGDTGKCFHTLQRGEEEEEEEGRKLSAHCSFIEDFCLAVSFLSDISFTSVDPAALQSVCAPSLFLSPPLARPIITCSEACLCAAAPWAPPRPPQTCCEVFEPIRVIMARADTSQQQPHCYPI